MNADTSSPDLTLTAYSERAQKSQRFGSGTQALQNLVENSIKYTDQGGQVQINVSMRQESIVFECIVTVTAPPQKTFLS